MLGLDGSRRSCVRNCYHGWTPRPGAVAGTPDAEAYSEMELAEPEPFSAEGGNAHADGEAFNVAAE